MTLELKGLRPMFYEECGNIWACPDEDENGAYYNVSIGDGANRTDYFVETALEAYKLVKRLTK